MRPNSLFATKWKKAGPLSLWALKVSLRRTERSVKGEQCDKEELHKEGDVGNIEHLARILDWLLESLESRET